MRKKLILFSNLILYAFSAVSQGSITLTPANTTIEAKINKPLIFSTGGLERLKIDNDGNIGIGQTNPNYKLDILHGGQTGVRIKSTESFSVLDIDAFNGDAALRFKNNGVTNWNIRNSPTSNNLQFIAANNLPSKLEIELSTGNIGVGIASPKSKLHVAMNNSGVVPHSSSILFLENNNNNFIQLGSPEVNETGILFGKPSNAASGGIIYSGDNKLHFRTAGNPSRLTISHNGNVGIGTTNPTEKLDVEGNINVRGTIILEREPSVNVTTSIFLDPLDRNGHSYAVVSTAAGQSITIRGIDSAPTGTILYLVAKGSGTTIIQNENATIVANKIITQNNANVTITGEGSATFIYDSGWRLISFLE